MNPKLRILIVAAVAIVAVVAFYKTALAPKYARAKTLEGQIDKSRGVTDEARAQTRALMTAKASYAGDYATVAGLGKAVPVDDDVRSLLVQLDTAAKRSRVDFRSIAVADSDTATPTTTSGSADATQTAAATLPPGASVGAAGLPTMPFSLEFRGTFLELSGFMARLERFVTVRGDHLGVTGRLLTVDGFSLAPKAPGSKIVTATLGVTAYLANPEQGATGGATASGPDKDSAPAAASTATPPLATTTTGVR